LPALPCRFTPAIKHEEAQNDPDTPDDFNSWRKRTPVAGTAAPQLC
jgi:hypothetical protein